MTPLDQLLPDRQRLRIAGRGAAGDYAAALLTSLGGRVERPLLDLSAADPHPACDWARSGAMALSGPADGPPRLAPGPLASCARGAAAALAALAEGANWSDLDAPALLGERAAIFGLERRGTTSPGGSCRLLRAADGWIALNLARPDDHSLLPAWLGDGARDDPWAFVEERVKRKPATEVVERGRLLGLPIAFAAEPPSRPPPWFRVAASGPQVRRDPAEQPLVVDLSSLWAGPLCTQLISRAGARVVKVESLRRPDGARSGATAFFDLLNAGKASVALDFGSDAGRATLRALIERADIVVESARPRALAQLGIDAAELVEKRPGLSWISITGYGRNEPNANWVAFGDDAAVAAGLATATGDPSGPPLFCGDAIADPLTGLHAALAAQAAFLGGGGRLLDLSLCDVAAHALTFDANAPAAAVHEAGDGWEVVANDSCASVAPPRARTVLGTAAELGRDTAEVLRELAIRC
ncbi:MAG: CoA transferase [Deltaproteobacteria bacterium]|nr:CoA transferase [Deltaproteobacteria bacterium]MBW2402011.1 CoA transferase [Deltaproteobacteria bacterium]